MVMSCHVTATRFVLVKSVLMVIYEVVYYVLNFNVDSTGQNF